MYLYLVADLIGSLIVAVQIEIYKPCRRTELHTHKTTEVVGKGIADHRLVAVISQKGPAFGIGKAVA